MSADRDRKLKRWGDELWRLLGEMQEEFGEHPVGSTCPKLECLTRYAWEEARDLLDAGRYVPASQGGETR